MSDLTRLQLARKVADAVAQAVLRTSFRRNPDDTRDEPTQAVLRTLHDTSTVFARVEQDADGIINGDVPQQVLE